MVKPVTWLSIPMPIFRLNFITKVIFIHLSKPLIFLDKPIILLTTSWQCIHIIAYYPCCIIIHCWFYPISQNLNMFTPTTKGISYVAIALTVPMFWESSSSLSIKTHVTSLSSPCQSLIAYKLPWWCIKEMVSQNYP